MEPETVTRNGRNRLADVPVTKKINYCQALNSETFFSKTSAGFQTQTVFYGV